MVSRARARRADLALATLALVALAPATARAEPTADLLGHWPFDDPPGSTTAANAVAGAPAALLLPGATLDGERVHLDGTPLGMVELPSEVGHFKRDDFTVAFRFQGSCSYGFCDLAGNRYVFAGGSYLSIRLCGPDSASCPAGIVVVEVCENDDLLHFAQVSSGKIDDGARHHVGVTRRGAELVVWIDGVRTDTAEADGVARVRNLRPFRLGRSLDADEQPGDNVQGAFDDLRIYGRALRACEVAELAAVPCAHECESVFDCPAPLACAPEGRCVERPRDDAGCALAPPRPSPRWVVLGLALALARAIRRARRARIAAMASFAAVLALPARAAATDAYRLTGHWAFDDPSGSTSAANAVPGGPPGTLLPGASLDGALVHLDGTAQGIVEFQPGVVAFGADDFSVAFRFDGSCAGPYCDLVGDHGALGQVGNYFGMRVCGAESEDCPPGRVSAAISEDYTGKHLAEVAGGAIDDGAVHHLAAIRRGVRFTLWIDGVEVDGYDDDGVAVIQSAHPLRLGRSQDFADENARFSVLGSFDDLRIYHRVLGVCELLHLAGAPCEARCETVFDCLPPLVCSLEGACVEPPPPDDGGCALAPGRPRSAALWLAALIVLTLRLRRIRARCTRP
jgi:concanavalin A-like lectin/glucanase superfamily protein